MVVFPRVRVGPARQAHRIRGWRVVLVMMVSWLGLGVSTGTAMTSSTGLSWALVGRACVPPAGAVVVGCGNLGKYLFAQDVSALTCQVVDSGPPEDHVYTIERPLAVVEGEPFSLELPFGGVASSPMPAAKSVTTLADAVVIDWNNSHGQAVLAIIGQIAGQSVVTELRALDDPDLLATLGPAVGDAHVLANLCNVIEEVDIHGADPPRVINLSFGRWTDDVFPDGCTDTLPCQVNGAVSHLTAAGVAVIAAAGNHRELLFPAVLRDTLSVGAFDLKRYGAALSAQESWETPLGVDVLMPGDGLCTTVELAAGTSFSSAALAGFLAANVEPNLTLTHAAATGVWRPTWIGGIGCFLLTTDSDFVPGCLASLDQFLIEAVTGTSCPRPDPPPGGGANSQAMPAKTVTALLPPTPKVPPRIPSFAQWQAESHSPTPGDEICTPCGGGGGSGGGGAAGVAASLPGKAVSMPVAGDDLVIDFSGSPKLRSTLGIADIYFRVGARFYPVLLDDADLLALERGEVDRLRLLKAALLPKEDEQPSLVFHLWEDLDGNSMVGTDELHWTSAPILIPIVLP